MNIAQAEPLIIRMTDAEMLAQLRENFFSVELLMWDHMSTIYIICCPRRGHGEDTPDLEGTGNSLHEAIIDTYNKWKAK